MMKKNKLVNASSIFYISIIVVTLTILGVWLWGVGVHHTIYQNSFLSTTIISISFFLFITIGLYNGYKLKDNFGKINEKSTNNKFANFSINEFEFGSGLGEMLGLGAEGGIEGLILGFLAWIGVSICIVLFVWILEPLFWTSILGFLAMLYWIFFRALRFVFQHSNTCNGKLNLSLCYGIFYTAVYNCWIYGIIFGLHFLKS